MSKKLLTIALLAVLPFFLTACSLADLPVIGKFFGKVAPKSGVVNIWGLWENPSVMAKLIATYEEKNPGVKINYDDRSILKDEQYRDTVVARMSEEGSEVPDIVLVHNSWVYRIKDKLSPAPQGVFDKDTYAQKFYSVAVNDAVLDGKVYAVPAYFDGLALVYNKKHFEAAEQDTPPTAWEEFRRLALSLTQRDGEGNIIRAGAALGTSNNIEFFSDIIGLMLVQDKVALPDDLTGEKAQGAMNFYTVFANDDHIWDASFPEASTAFSQERVSMIFVPSWNLLDIIRSRPDLDIGVAPVPQAYPNDPTSWGSFWMYAVPEKAANKAAAWDFINYLATEEAQLAMFSEASALRDYGAPYSLSSLADEIKNSSAEKYLKPYLDTANNAKSSFFAGRVGNTAAVNALREAVDSMTTATRDRRASAEEALSAVKQKIVGR